MRDSLDDLLRADLFRYGGDLSPAARRRTRWREPGFRFTWHLRKVAHYAAHKRGAGLLPYLFHRFWLNHYRFRYGFDISPTTQIGPGLFIGHFGSIVVSPYAVLGSNVNLAKGVVIGAASRGKRKGAPVLEDRVWIGSNAIIVGRITVGRGALIAPGAYVNFDVPPSALVLGNPGRIVSYAGSVGYVNHMLPGTEGPPLLAGEPGATVAESLPELDPG